MKGMGDTDADEVLTLGGVRQAAVRHDLGAIRGVGAAWKGGRTTHRSQSVGLDIKSTSFFNARQLRVAYRASTG